MSKFTVNFPHTVREAMSLAHAVVYQLRSWPVPMLSIRGQKDNPIFHFEGGTVVQIHMVELSQFEPSWAGPRREDWVVTHVTIRYYAGDESRQKVQELWGAEELLELRGNHYFPIPVQDRSTICGKVGVFFDWAAETGFTEVDPETNQVGHARMVDEVMYQRLLEGDRARAEEEAREKLARLYRG